MPQNLQISKSHKVEFNLSKLIRPLVDITPLTEPFQIDKSINIGLSFKNTIVSPIHQHYLTF